MRADQVLGPGEELAGLGAEELDDGIGDVVEAGTALLHVEVSGRAPEGLFADEPDAVDDVVDKAALSFKALGEDKALKLGVAAKALRFVARTIAVALELKKAGGEDGAPSGLLIGLGLLDHGRAEIFGNRLPGGAFVPARIGMVLVSGKKMAGKEILSEGGGKQVLRRCGGWRGLGGNDGQRAH